MRKAVAVTAAVLGLVLVPAAVADAAPAPKKYKNCAALNLDYPHGVAQKKGVVDKVRGKTKPVKNYSVSKQVYDLNKKALDRDKDLIVCEKL